MSDESRLTGNINTFKVVVDLATIKSPSNGALLQGMCRERHDDGTATISLGGVVDVRGELIRFIPRS